MKPLLNSIPPKWRKRVYAVGSAAVAVYGIWEATGGDWRAFAVSVVTTAVGIMAATNTDTDTDTTP